MKMTLEQVNTICMEMISSAGEGRALVYEALDAILQKDYQAADAKLTQAEAHLSEAHRIQFEELMAPQKQGDRDALFHAAAARHGFDHVHHLRARYASEHRAGAYGIAAMDSGGNV